MRILGKIRNFLESLDEEEEVEEVSISPGFISPGESMDQEEGVCFLRESPLRILRVAEKGNVREFQRILSGDPTKLIVHDSRGRRPVHQAAAKNQVGILKLILESHGELNLVDREGNTPLHLAVDAEAIDAIEFLLKYCANGGILNKKHQTPLHLAAELNKINSLRAFSPHILKLDVNKGGEEGRTALHLACIHDHPDCVTILIEELFASPRRACAHSYLPVHEAAKHASSRALRALLESGAKSGCPMEEMMSLADAEGNLPIHSAIHGGDRQTVRICLEAGAKISVPQHEKSTAVHLACAQGSLDIVKLMFELQPEEKGSSLNSCNVERLTPLHYAAMFDHTDLVEFLVSQGACLDLLDKNRRTPLHLAASRNAWMTVKALILLGADTRLQDVEGNSMLHTIVKHDGDLCRMVDEDTTMCLIPILEVRDKRGNTALHIATKQGQISSVSKLLTLGASIMAKNSEGENIFHIACRYGRTKIMQQIIQLQSFSLVINESNGSGATPLHIAAREGHHRVLHTLMQKGALLHRDHGGRTPLHLAAENGHTEAMKTILSTHSHLIDLVDKNGNTPLHSAALNNQAKAADLLLRLGCELKYNDDGCSAIDYGIMHKFIELAFVMVTHKSRADQVLGMTQGKYPCIMEALISKIPGVAKAVLDSSIRKSSQEKPDSPSFHVEYDFKWLTKPKSMRDEERGKRSPPEQRFLPILNVMVAHGRVTLLSHELSIKYLQMKWNAYGKYVQYTSTIFYLAYLAMLTLVCTHPLGKGDEFWPRFYEFHEKIPPNMSRQACKSLIFSPDYFTNGIDPDRAKWIAARSLYFNKKNWEHNDNDMFVLLVAIAVISVLNMLVEVISIFRHGLKYCQNVDTWVWIVMNTACFVATGWRLLGAHALINSSLAVAAFMGWFYLLLIFQRFDSVGLYVSMFLEILKTLLRVLIIFSILIMAFAVAFYILLSNGNHIVFSTFPMSVMRTFSMMLGDLDFMNTFAYPHHCGEMEREGREDTKSYSCLTECQYSRRIPDPYTTFPAVAVYMIFMPIVMINLLIGLAVGDIESVRKNAQLKRLTMQVQSHTNLEKVLPKCFIRRVDRNIVVEHPNVPKKYQMFRATFIKFFQHNIPNKDENEEVDIESNDLMEAILENSSILDNLSSDMDSMKSMLALVCNKMGVSTTQKGAQANAEADKLRPLPEIRRGFQRNPNSRLSRRTPKLVREESTESTTLH